MGRLTNLIASELEKAITAEAEKHNLHYQLPLSEWEMAELVVTKLREAGYAIISKERS